MVIDLEEHYLLGVELDLDILGKLVRKIVSTFSKNKTYNFDVFF